MDWIDFTHTHLLKRERESFVLLLKILPFLEHKLPPARAEEDRMHRRCCSRRHHRDEDVVSFFFDLIRVASSSFSSSSSSSFAAREKKLFLSVNARKKASSHAIGDLEKKRRMTTTTTTTTTTTISATKAIRRLRFLLKYPRVKENLSVERGAACLKSILPQRYMKSTISSSGRIREDEDEAKTKDHRQRLLQLQGASVDDSARRNKRKEDISMLETTLERLKFSLEVAEKRAKEEMERMARGADDEDEEDDDDSFDSSAFLTLKKERGRQRRQRSSDSDSGATTTTMAMEKRIEKTMVTAS